MSQGLRLSYFILPGRDPPVRPEEIAWAGDVAHELYRNLGLVGFQHFVEMVKITLDNEVGRADVQFKLIFNLPNFSEITLVAFYKYESSGLTVGVETQERQFREYGYILLDSPNEGNTVSRVADGLAKGLSLALVVATREVEGIVKLVKRMAHGISNYSATSIEYHPIFAQEIGCCSGERVGW